MRSQSNCGPELSSLATTPILRNESLGGESVQSALAWAIQGARRADDRNKCPQEGDPQTEPVLLQVVRLRSFVMNDAILDPLESPLAQTDDNPDRVSEIVRRSIS